MRKSGHAGADLDKAQVKLEFIVEVGFEVVV